MNFKVGEVLRRTLTRRKGRFLLSGWVVWKPGNGFNWNPLKALEPRINPRNEFLN